MLVSRTVRVGPLPCVNEVDARYPSRVSQLIYPRGIYPIGSRQFPYLVPLRYRCWRAI
jgi:hypothetical protein